MIVLSHNSTRTVHGLRVTLGMDSTDHPDATSSCHCVQIILKALKSTSSVQEVLSGWLMGSNMEDMYQALVFFGEGSLPWASPAYTVQRLWTVNRGWTVNHGDVFCLLTSIHKDCIIGYVAQQVRQWGHFISPLIQCKVMRPKKNTIPQN